MCKKLHGKYNHYYVTAALENWIKFIYKLKKTNHVPPGSKKHQEVYKITTQQEKLQKKHCHFHDTDEERQCFQKS